MIEVLSTIHRESPIAQLFSHEETGNALTYARDKAVKKWCRANRVDWHETPTNGVVRCLKSRDGWAAIWEDRMAAPIILTPEAIPGYTSKSAFKNVKPIRFDYAQAGGEGAAHEVFDDFLSRRGRFYAGGISSPNSAESACSRLSPYLAWGNLSLKQVVQTTRQRVARLDPRDPSTTFWRRSLRAFDERLHWRCHFVQKLESEPEIEHRCFVTALEGLRENDFNPDYFAAWCEGKTGYPLIDACMRCLDQTGWLTFRMRAMVTAFASYQLWLDWRPTALHCARAWTDYEPGIHYSQFQMQSGTTGINTLRIYNPTKQAQDHDPDGVFIRRWIPELASVPTAWIHEPWRMPSTTQDQAGITIGRDYPAPIVDHLESIALAKRKISEHRAKSHEYWSEVSAVNRKHGSRRRMANNPRPQKPKSPRLAPQPGPQRSLFDD